VIGLTRAAATTRLQHAGLRVHATSAYSDTVAKGRVTSSDPARDEKVRHGGTVTITVSLGVEQYRVPRLLGDTADQAETRLSKIKMHVGGPVERWSETVADGQVIRTDPAAGTVLRPGHTVTVYVSKGRRPITVADWTHRNAELAARALEHRGLNVDTEADFSDTVRKGAVISESPEAGTVLHKGDTVTLLVSKGPPLVEVPHVAGSGVDAATRTLEDAGFTVDVRHYTPYFGLGFVMRQESAGEKLPRGSAVTIWIS
jgi:serine/threonine-protein kinase